ncbi:MAG: cation diffusion facilitator family transporter, partial [Bacillota bacterium]
LILAVVKLVIGLISGSFAILSDAINNFGDVVTSSGVALSFIVSNKKADKNHPYGHGRFEYAVSFGIAIIIIVVAIEFLINSIGRIVDPQPVNFSWLFFSLIALGIAIKLGMAIFYHISNKQINSSTIKAAKFDSVQDIFISSTTLVSFSLSQTLTLPLDGIIAGVISIVILINGVNLIKSTMNDILGKKPDHHLSSKIMSEIMSYPNILGAHDLLLHDYGHNNYLGSVHVELACSLSLKFAHKITDELEKIILQKYNVNLVIHLDPVDTSDVESKNLKRAIRKTLQDINPQLTYHDFRLNKDKKKITIDLVIPFELQKAQQEIISRIKENFKDYKLEFIIDNK